MDTRTITHDEALILDEADNDMANHDGKTEIKCPRCGKDIEVIEYGKSYIVKCVDDNCISASYRGI